MNRTTKIVTVVGAAALTFGVLFATVGPRQYGHHGHCHASSCSADQAPADAAEAPKNL